MCQCDLGLRTEPDLGLAIDAVPEPPCIRSVTWAGCIRGEFSFILAGWPTVCALLSCPHLHVSFRPSRWLGRPAGRPPLSRERCCSPCPALQDWRSAAGLRAVADIIPLYPLHAHGLPRECLLLCWGAGQCRIFFLLVRPLPCQLVCPLVPSACCGLSIGTVVRALARRGPQLRVGRRWPAAYAHSPVRCQCQDCQAWGCSQVI